MFSWRFGKVIWDSELSERTRGFTIMFIFILSVNTFFSTRSLQPITALLYYFRWRISFSRYFREVIFRYAYWFINAAGKSTEIWRKNVKLVFYYLCFIDVGPWVTPRQQWKNMTNTWTSLGTVFFIVLCVNKINWYTLNSNLLLPSQLPTYYRDNLPMVRIFFLKITVLFRISERSRGDFVSVPLPELLFVNLDRLNLKLILLCSIHFFFFVFPRSVQSRVQ